MDALAKQLDAKLRKWQPEMADQVRRRIAEIIELAHQDVFRCVAVSPRRARSLGYDRCTHNPVKSGLLILGLAAKTRPMDAMSFQIIHDHYLYGVSRC